MSGGDISYYFVHWLDLDGNNHSNETIDGYSLELMKVTTNLSFVFSAAERLPVAMSKDSIFRINRYHQGKTQNTIGIVYSIEDILPGKVKVLGESHYQSIDFETFRQTGQISLKVEELPNISDCEAVVVYISSIEVEYIHFMLKHPFTLGDVIRIYTYSKKNLIKQSSFFKVINIFKELNLKLPLVFCVKALTEPSSYETSIGTRDEEDCSSCTSD